jgi:hypothetical protein
MSSTTLLLPIKVPTRERERERERACIKSHGKEEELRTEDEETTRKIISGHEFVDQLTESICQFDLISRTDRTGSRDDDVETGNVRPINPPSSTSSSDLVPWILFL